ncbi:MAG: hypothetical protein WBS24_09805 [Terriglobales bacterium]
MSRIGSYVPTCIAVALLALVCTGCGSSHTSSSNNMSQAQAQAVSQELVQAVEQALNNAFSGSAWAKSPTHSPLAEALSSIRPEDSSPCTIGSSIDCTINSSASCPQGGTVSVSGSIDGTLNNGSGSIDTTLTVTPNKCALDSVVINGDPDVAFTSDFNFTNDALDFPITATTNGGISYGPNPSGSCTMNVTITINSATSCSVTGSVCGQSVNGSC